jgi:hypothetical protein
VSRRRGIDLATTVKYLRRTTSGASGIDLGTTINYLCGAAATAGRNDQAPSTPSERHRG